MLSRNVSTSVLTTERRVAIRESHAAPIVSMVNRKVRTGVYIPTRHSGAVVNVAVGDRLFTGRHERANFTSAESDDEIAVAFTARDSQCFVETSVGMRDVTVEWHSLGSLSPATAIPRSRQPEFGRRENRWPRLNTTGMLC